METGPTPSAPSFVVPRGDSVWRLRACGSTGSLLFLSGMLPTVGHEAKFLARAPRIKVFDVAETDRAEEEETAVAAAKSSGGVVVDWNITGTL